MTSLTWAKLKGLKTREERKEAIMLKIEKLVIVFCYFVLGYFIGRFVEAIMVGHLNFYY